MSHLCIRVLLLAGIVASTSIPAFAQAVPLVPTIETVNTQGPDATGSLEAWESRLDISVSDFNPGTRLNVFLTLSDVPSLLQASYVGSLVVGDDRNGRFQLQGYDLARAFAVFSQASGPDGAVACTDGACGVARLPFVRLHFADPVNAFVGRFDIDGESGPVAFGSVSLPDPLPPTPVTGSGDQTALEAELTRAQARIIDLEGALARANESLALREADVRVAQARIVSLEGELVRSQTDLAAARAALATREADLAAARLRIAELERQLATGSGGTNPHLSAMQASVNALEQRLRVLFRNPRFTIPGSTPTEKFNNVVQLLLNVNRWRGDRFDDRDPWNHGRR
jgi:hypothetical protein